jgi:hypothetical protein
MINKYQQRFKTLTERLEEKIERIPESGCWIWMGSVAYREYGIISYQGKRYKVHRLMWELHNNKKIPEGMEALHRCDTPPCMNPDHIFIGTKKDNMQDCIKKGRFKRPFFQGENHKNSKLKNDQIIKILSDKDSFRAIAKKYGVASSTISAIKCRQTWKHVVVPKQ